MKFFIILAYNSEILSKFVGEMKAKKSANSKVPSRALHAKSRKDSCPNNVHPDVILDADEALRNILGRLTKLEDEVAR